MNIKSSWVFRKCIAIPDKKCESGTTVETSDCSGNYLQKWFVQGGSSIAAFCKANLVLHVSQANENVELGESDADDRSFYIISKT